MIIERRVLRLRPDGIWQVDGLWSAADPPATAKADDGLYVRVKVTPRAVYYALKETS